MQSTERFHTQIIVGDISEFSLIRAQLAWTAAKKKQVLADGTSGVITSARLAILEDLGPHQSQPPAEKKTPEESATIPRRNSLCAKLGQRARGASEQ